MPSKAEHPPTGVLTVFLGWLQWNSSNKRSLSFLGKASATGGGLNDDGMVAAVGATVGDNARTEGAGLTVAVLRERLAASV